MSDEPTAVCQKCGVRVPFSQVTPEAREQAKKREPVGSFLCAKCDPPPAPEEPLLRYFAWEHLQSEQLRDVSRRFAHLAQDLVALLPRCAERTVAIRKLLESKDAGVRAALP